MMAVSVFRLTLSIPPLIFFFLSLLHQQQTEAQDVPFPEKEPNILFLGNSYINSNDLASLTKNLLEAGIPEWDADSGGGRGVTVKRRDPGAERFAGHLAAIKPAKTKTPATETPRKNEPVRNWLISSSSSMEPPIFFQWVVLQEQSQIPGYYDLGKNAGGNLYDTSLQAAKQLNDIVAANGAQTLFLMTWGRRNGDLSHNPELFPNYATMQNYLVEGYKRYVNETSTEDRPTFVAPVGLVFQAIYEDVIDSGQDPTQPGNLFYDLYEEDGSHPSLAGSYVAALTIYSTMTGKNPKEVVWFPPHLEPRTRALIQDAVSRTILQTYTDQTIDYPWETPWANHDTFISEL